MFKKLLKTTALLGAASSLVFMRAKNIKKPLAILAAVKIV